jgi:hypothetical protein
MKAKLMSFLEDYAGAVRVLQMVRESYTHPYMTALRVVAMRVEAVNRMTAYMLKLTEARKCTLRIGVYRVGYR